MAGDRFEGVSVVKKANAYFGGKVTSRTVLFPDGSRKTLGVMLEGEYEFGTEAAERMEVLAGEMRVRLPGAAEFRTFRAGDAFDVPSNSKFQLEIPELADYCCSYL
jgi:purine/pyrimidine-nucleoside phosphorylase